MTDAKRPKRIGSAEKRPENPRDRKRIREAGPKEMKNPPEDWDIVDEENDESFPASDPPANY